MPRLGALLSSHTPFTQGPTVNSCLSTGLTILPLTPNLLDATIRIQSPIRGTIPSLTRGLLLNTSIVRVEGRASTLSLSPPPNLLGMPSTTRRGQASFKYTKHSGRGCYWARRIWAASNRRILTRCDRHAASNILLGSGQWNGALFI